MSLGKCIEGNKCDDSTASAQPTIKTMASNTDKKPEPKATDQDSVSEVTNSDASQTVREQTTILLANKTKVSSQKTVSSSTVAKKTTKSRDDDESRSKISIDECELSFETSEPGNVVESCGMKMVVLSKQETTSTDTMELNLGAAPDSSLESCTFTELSNDLLAQKAKEVTASQLTGQKASSQELVSEPFNGVPNPYKFGMPDRDYQPGDRVTIWNRAEKRKIAGNAAPLFKNLARYFASHANSEVYNGQDYALGRAQPRRRSRSKMAPREVSKNDGGHVAIWNKKECRKVAGNAAPLKKNVDAFLAKRPHCEIYDGQDRKEGCGGKVLKRLATGSRHFKSSTPDISFAALFCAELGPPTFLFHEKEDGSSNDSDDFLLHLFGSTGDHDQEADMGAFSTAAPFSPMEPVEAVVDNIGDLDDIEKVTTAMDIGGFSPRMVKI